jgi:prepilin-type N-terminal cleavage/methylation domain-containing protein
MFSKIRKTSGYTLIEIIVASAIFATVITVIGAIMVNFYQAQRKQRITSDLYEESRYLMERLVREARVNTLDFQEYWSHQDGAIGYGVRTTDYENRFWCYYDDNGVMKKLRNEGWFDTKADTDCLVSNDDVDAKAIDDNKQDELYLVSADGRTKTIIKRIPNGIDDDQNGIVDDGGAEDTGKEWAAISKMVVGNDEIGSLAWVPHDDFLNSTLTQPECTASANHSWIGGSVNKCLEFVTITPSEVEISNLIFYVSPLEDSRKAFNENEPSIQMQPHVTIVLEARTARKLANSIKGYTPDISLQTTISSRVYHSIFFPEL